MATSSTVNEANRGDYLEIRRWPALGRMRLGLSGELDFGSCSALRSATEELLVDGWDVDIDLESITFIDCSGLHLLDELSVLARARGRQLTIVSASPTVRDTACLVGHFAA